MLLDHPLADPEPGRDLSVGEPIEGAEQERLTAAGRQLVDGGGNQAQLLTRDHLLLGAHLLVRDAGKVEMGCRTEEARLEAAPLAEAERDVARDEEQEDPRLLDLGSAERPDQPQVVSWRASAALPSRRCRKCWRAAPSLRCSASTEPPFMPLLQSTWIIAPPLDLSRRRAKGYETNYARIQKFYMTSKLRDPA